MERARGAGVIDVNTTTTALLEGLLDEANGAAWRELDERFRPIIHAIARRAGLDEADAADIAQETLLRFVKAYRRGQYDRSKGRLRSWIIGMIAYRVADLRKARAARREARGDSAFVVLPSRERLTKMWDEEYHREILHRALQELRRTTRTKDTTVEAFEMFVFHRQPAAAVAENLGLTPHDVYMAKRRITERLRGIVDRLDAVYRDDP